MKSAEYRSNIRAIVRNTIFKHIPGIKRKEVEELATKIAVAVHARFYGADVDNVASPIWRDDSKLADIMANRQPKKTAQELLDEQPSD